MGSCKSILIVEDDEAIRTSLSDVLTGEGYQVFEASNGKVGMEALGKVPEPSLVLLDLMMPVMNGYDFSDQVRKSGSFANFPIVVMSASRDGEQFAKIHNYPFLKKPLDVDVLLKLVEKHFGP